MCLPRKPHRPRIPSITKGTFLSHFISSLKCFCSDTELEDGENMLAPSRMPRLQAGALPLP